MLYLYAIVDLNYYTRVLHVLFCVATLPNLLRKVMYLVVLSLHFFQRLCSFILNPEPLGAQYYYCCKFHLGPRPCQLILVGAEEK